MEDEMSLIIECKEINNKDESVYYNPEFISESDFGGLEQLKESLQKGSEEIWTVKRLFDKISIGVEWEYCLSSFKHDFLLNYAFDTRLIDDEPIRYANIAKEKYAIVASLVHYWCIQNGIAMPEWILRPEYVLDKDYVSKLFYGDRKANPKEFSYHRVYMNVNKIEVL